MSDAELDYGDVWDGYHRQREYEEAEHLPTQEHRRADTLIEHRPARPDPKPVKRAPRRTGRTDQLWRWKLAVLERDQGCCVHLNPADCREGWQAHHVVAQQELAAPSKCIADLPLHNTLVLAAALPPGSVAAGSGEE